MKDVPSAAERAASLAPLKRQLSRVSHPHSSYRVSITAPLLPHKVPPPLCLFTGFGPKGIPSNYIGAAPGDLDQNSRVGIGFKSGSTAAVRAPAYRDLSPWPLSTAALRKGLGELPGIHGDWSSWCKQGAS